MALTPDADKMSAPPLEPEAIVADADSAHGNLRIVGIGASAGGLDSVMALLGAMPVPTGMAFVFVQHLAPDHDSLVVALLSSHTGLSVVEAADAMHLEPEHLYVIAPGTYLAVREGAFSVTSPPSGTSVRLPFNHFLHSLAVNSSENAAAVVLSGTGDDGSDGVRMIKERGGLVIAETPEAAQYGGMPKAAVATGTVDLVLAAADIPHALAEWHLGQQEPTEAAPVTGISEETLGDILQILRERTSNNFSLYKRGTLQRRIAHRMLIAGYAVGQMPRYLDYLRREEGEAQLLAQDLLINVTRFFRDPEVFACLAQEVVPSLVENSPTERGVRIWVPGCSSGEEAYSLAMLFMEAMSAAGCEIKLQVFASDLDAAAIARAREGSYPLAITDDVSEERLGRFFTRTDTGYKVTPELRANVIFTVQDVLSDPPFSRLDMVSCRNLLIYLQPEAQEKVIGILCFALRDGGILLLGKSETIGQLSGRFEAMAPAERIYKRLAAPSSPPPEIAERIREVPAREQARLAGADAPPPPNALAGMVNTLLIGDFAPATVVIDGKNAIVYSIGPTDRYLRIAEGEASLDVLTMARPEIRPRLRSAIHRATKDAKRIIASGGQIGEGSARVNLLLDVRPVTSGTDTFLLVCFIVAPLAVGAEGAAGAEGAPPALSGVSRELELEHELDAIRRDLDVAQGLLRAGEDERRRMLAESLSVSEEYQSTNEELLTSQEELQSLNEELTVLNGQLQETLERQRTTSNDLQNVLYSTNVATLFLDSDFRIRFFTPAIQAIFHLLPTDVGRPLSDLRPITKEADFLVAAPEVLRTGIENEREIETQSGQCYVQRIMPYRADGDIIDGVVMTFTDISESKRINVALEAARQAADEASAAKSRFLGAASHDLRQPLQTLTLLTGLLTRIIDDERAMRLVIRLDEALLSMRSMLDVLLDINQIEAGTLVPILVDVPVGELLQRLAQEFQPVADAQGIGFRVVGTSLIVRSDRRLLEQMIRNLLANALKYTRVGRVLVGCRRHGERLSIEIFDTGIGISDVDRSLIFQEFHQVDNAARQRNRGLGLGLSIVRRLGVLLHHDVDVSSRLGLGSVFSIMVPLAEAAPVTDAEQDPFAHQTALGQAGALAAVVEARPAVLLLIEDDPDLAAALREVLEAAGHLVTMTEDGKMALRFLASAALRPDAIIADFDLPGDMNGLDVIARARASTGAILPGLVLTGDITIATMRRIHAESCAHLYKPATAADLGSMVQRLLAGEEGGTAALAEGASEDHLPPGIVYLVDERDLAASQLEAMLGKAGFRVTRFREEGQFLEAYVAGENDCVLVALREPAGDGVAFIRQIRQAHPRTACVGMNRGQGIVATVEAMKAGATDVIQLPASRGELLATVRTAGDIARNVSRREERQRQAAARVATLSQAQREIMGLLLAGKAAEVIAPERQMAAEALDEEIAEIMRKMEAATLQDLARVALAARPLT